MPITRVSEAPNRELHDSLSAKVNLLGDRPPGLILHAAGETATETVPIVNIWESRAHADALARDRLLPVFEAAGITERVTKASHPVIAETFEFEYVG